MTQNPRLAGVMEAATDAYIAADIAGAIVDWNLRAEEILGWSRPEAVGRDLIAILVPGALRPGSITTAASLFEMAGGPVAGRRMGLEAIDREGRTVALDMTLWRTSVGDSATLHMLFHEVGDHDAHDLYRMATLVLDEAIFGVGTDGSIQSWNFGAERTFGYAGIEVVGKGVSVLVPAEEHARVAGWWKAMVAGERAQRHEIAGVRRNGVVIQLDVTISPIRDRHGVVSGGSVLARDVTEQRWTTATLERALGDLEAALKEARDSEASYRRFLADAAHQLRTPIAGIRANAETLLRIPCGEDDREALLLNVVRETSRASRVMTGVLRMARVDHGETLTVRSCDIVALCADEVERARSLAPQLEVDLRVDARPPSPPKLDRHMVCEILANLLDNARRHAVNRVEVAVTADDDTVTVSVLDDGAGLPEASAERVFERFVSLDGKGGSGLGLPIARALARAHGGELVYDDGFVLRLPGEAPVECGGAGRPGPLPPS